MKYFENLSDLHEEFNIQLKHPLIDIQRYSDIIPLFPMEMEPAVFGFYKISFVKNFNGYMEYGKTKFTGTNGVLYFVEPGQTYSCTSTETWEGYQILVHPDIYKSHLSEKNINAYDFFSYDVNESLLLTQDEENTVSFIMKEAWSELNNKKDDYSIPIVLSYISTLLNTSERFYARQFTTRKTMCNQLSGDFFQLLKTYYTHNENSSQQPSLAFFSEKLNVTSNYLSDTIRHHSGKSALNIIHDYIVEEAKMLLTSSNQTVSEISSVLGFEYPNYFSRLFKRKTKLSPSEFRKSVKSI